MNRQWCRVGVALDGWVLLCCLVAGLVCGPLLPVPVAAQGGFIILCQRSCWLRGVNVVVPMWCRMSRGHTASVASWLWAAVCIA